MDRPSGNKLGTLELSYDEDIQLTGDVVEYIKNRTENSENKTAFSEGNSFPNFDELGTLFDLSYDDIENICDSNPELNFYCSIKQNYSILDLPRCAWVVCYES